eukprot:733531_1
MNGDFLQKSGISGTKSVEKRLSGSMTFSIGSTYPALCQCGTVPFLSSDSLNIDDLRQRMISGGAKSLEHFDEDVEESDKHVLEVVNELLLPFRLSGRWSLGISRNDGKSSTSISLPKDMDLWVLLLMSLGGFAGIDDVIFGVIGVWQHTDTSRLCS